MEPVAPSARLIGMMPHGPLRRGLVVAAGWGLLCAVVAGCGSVVASSSASSSPSGAAASSASGSGAAASSSASGGASVALAGCASASQATAVSVTRLTRLEVPVDGGTLVVTNREPAQARALFRDFCNAVTHPDVRSAVMQCPADFGTNYTGVFYDGNRVLARYTYDASGCRRVGVIIGSITRSTVLAGPAVAAAPHLVADFAAVLTGARPSVIPTTSNMNRGGTGLRKVARLVEVELAVLDAEHERLPFGLGEVQLVAVGLGRVVHHVQLGLAGLVRGGRGVGGDVHLDPALLGIRCVVTRCVHALRVPVPRSSRVPPDRVVCVPYQTDDVPQSADPP